MNTILLYGLLFPYNTVVNRCEKSQNLENTRQKLNVLFNCSASAENNNVVNIHNTTYIKVHFCCTTI